MHDVGVGDRVFLALEHLAGDQTGEVGHVHHQDGADLVGDLAHPAVVDVPGIGAEAGQQDQWLDLDRLALDGVVIEQEGLAVHGVAMRLEHLARGIEPVAVREVAPRGEIHAQQPLIAQPLADLVPLGGRQLVPVPGSQGTGPLGCQELGHGGQLDARSEDGPEGDEVGIRAAVRLGIGVRRAEELAGPLVRQVLDRIDVVAAGVESVVGNPFGVLVGQQVGHGALGRQRRIVFAGDQLDVAPLVGQLLDDRPGDLGRHAGHGLQIGEIGQESRCNLRGRLPAKIRLDQ